MRGSKLSINRIFAIICICVGTLALAVGAVATGALLRDNPDTFYASGSGIPAINSGHVDGLFPIIAGGSMGGSHALAISGNGDLYSWGRNNSGQLGLGFTSNGSAAHPVPQHVDDGDRKYKAVAANGQSSLAIAENGDLYSWGQNYYGQLGLGFTSGLFTAHPTPQHVNDGNRKYKAIAGGHNHALAIAENGDLYSWGWNIFGQLGLGDTTDRNTPQHVSDGGRKYKAIAGGDSHTVAIAENGDLYLWGENANGQLGLGDNIGRSTPQHVSDGNRKYKAIAACDDCSLAIAENGDLYSWGGNFFGQLGLGDTTDRNTPQHVNDGNRKYKAISSGPIHCLAITENGDLYSWGWNSNGQLGLGFTSGWYDANPNPQHVNDDDRKYKVIAACETFSFAITEDWELYACGDNWNGSLGLGPGDTTDRDVLTLVYGVTIVPSAFKITATIDTPADDGGVYVSEQQLPAINSGHVDGLFPVIVTGGHCSYAIDENGDLYAWGENNWGQLGLGNTTDYDTPQHVSDGGRKYKAIAGSGAYTLALAENGDLYTWGRNPSGNLGIGITGGQYETPQHVNHGGRKYKAISAQGCSAAIALNGDLYLWGGNSSGILGLGVTGGTYNTPQHVTHGNHKYKAVAVGGGHILAIAQNGDLYSWGSNGYGQLGLGNNTDRNLPQHVSAGGRKYKAISAGSMHSLAIAENGDLYACGHNLWGQLGLGNTADRNTLQHVNTSSLKYKVIAGGQEHSLAIAENGDLYAWGRNAFGELGIGNTLQRNTPQHASDGNRQYEVVAAGAYTSFAIDESGDLFVVGRNDYAQLGLGDKTNRHFPTPIP